MNLLDPFDIRGRIAHTLLYEKVEAEMWLIIDAAIKRYVERYAKGTLESLVERVGADILPETDHYAAIKAEWQEQIKRWPAIQSDHQMQLNVARTILRSFVR
jgi:hypothetical protein